MRLTLDDAVEDLKQFIVTVVGQEALSLQINLRAELGTELQKLDDKLSHKIVNLSIAIAEALETNGEATDGQLHDHHHRIIRPEHKAA